MLRHARVVAARHDMQQRREKSATTTAPTTTSAATTTADQVAIDGTGGKGGAAASSHAPIEIVYASEEGGTLPSPKPRWESSSARSSRSRRASSATAWGPVGAAKNTALDRAAPKRCRRNGDGANAGLLDDIHGRLVAQLGSGRKRAPNLRGIEVERAAVVIGESNGPSLQFLGDRRVTSSSETPRLSRADRTRGVICND